METQEKFTKLLPTDLIAVEVPSDATDVQVWIDFEILGEVISDNISFDAKAYVKKQEAELQYWDYENNCFGLVCQDESFYSLIGANGLNWVNPIEKPKGTNLESSFFEMQVDFNQEKLFEEAKEKLIKGKLIILKPIL